MPCQIGQNIHRLQKKNRQLLDQLESNSVLLENKIQRLRHTTRSPRNSNKLKTDLLTSPMKRRHESWNARNSSSHVAGALIKSDSYLSDDTRHHVQISKKTLLNESKKTPKRSRHNVLISKPEVKRSCSRLSKGRMQTNIKKKINSLCYCSKMYDAHLYHMADPKGYGECCHKKNVEHKTKPKHLKGSVTIATQTNDESKSFNKTENQDEDMCLKCTEEARCLLNYSPESVFLRRMKERLQKRGNAPRKDHSNINQICSCINTKKLPCDSPSCSLEKNVCKSHCNINNKGDDVICSVGYESDNDEKLSDTKEKSKHKTEESTSNTIVKMKGKTSQKNIPRSVSSTKSLPAKEPRKCMCKKKIGGLCCCEVSCTVHTETKFDVPHEDDENSDTSSVYLKSSANAATVPLLKSNTSEKVSHICSGKLPSNKLKSSHIGRSEKQFLQVPMDNYENKTEGLNSKLSRNIHSTGYDVIAGLVDNEHKKYSADPCTHKVEELNEFRQKHWFDCHAHPHSITTNKYFSDNKEYLSHGGCLDDDLLQATLDPCIRSYRLNQRLFSEIVKEKHGAGCCVAQQGGCVSPQLLPTQRRLITLPTVPQKITDKSHETVKVPRGVHSFPESNILIRDPAPLTRKQSQIVTRRCARAPVPSNTLALRFQKGVAQVMTSEL